MINHQLAANSRNKATIFFVSKSIEIKQNSYVFKSILILFGGLFADWANPVGFVLFVVILLLYLYNMYPMGILNSFIT